MAADLNAPVVPQMHFSDFISELLEKRCGRVPLFGTLETTFRCNLNCIHCYVNQPVHEPKIQNRELSTKRLLRLMDELAGQGCLNLLMTGGEVLVRPDFSEVYRYAARKGLRVTVFTNGTLVSNEIVALFKETPPHAVEITLYGMTAETYERITRARGSFKGCIRGIVRLQRAGISLRLKSMLMTWNVHELTAMRQFAQKMGLPFRHDGLLNPRVDGGVIPLEKLQLPMERLAAIDLENPALRQRMKGAFQGSEGFTTDTRKGDGCDHRYSCGAGNITFNVDPYGRLQMCQLARKAFISLRNDSFENGWLHFLPSIRSRSRNRPSVCDTCSLSSFCQNCAGAAELERQDPDKPVARFCRLTHIRMHQLIGAIPGHRPDAGCCLKGDNNGKRNPG